MTKLLVLLLLNVALALLPSSASMLDYESEFESAHPNPLLQSYSLTGPSSRLVERTESLSPESEQCLKAMLEVFAGNYTNSLAMLLYSGKEPGDYGNYLECQDLSNAHFCTLRYQIKNITTVLASAGICIPIVCRESDVVWALKKVPNPSWSPIFSATTAECVPKHRQKLSPGGVATVILICVLASIVLLATSIDLIRRFIATPDIPIASPIVTRFDYHDANDPSPVSKKGDFARARSPINHDSTEPNDMGLTEDPAHHVPLLEPPPPPPPESLWLKALFSFSIPVNLAKLTKHFPNNKTNLNPLNMVRVMAMMWVVLGHTALFTVFIGYTNPIQAVKRLLPSVPFQILLNGTLSVDVFFYLAGFLMAYFTLKELRQRNGKMNWIIVFLHRLWRMGPTMVLALFFCWTVAPSMGNGPWWRTFMTWTTEACSKYWWTNLLFINNFWNFDLDQTCLGWSWYMSTDMQFFLLAIPIVYIIYKRPKLGFILIAILSVASLSFVAGISAKRHLSPMVTHMDDGFRKYLYTKPWARISTFFIGIIGAYLLLDHEDRAQSPHGFRKLPLFKQSILVTASWIIAIVMVLVPIFATYSAYQYQAKPWSNAANAAFLTLSRPCFTLGLAIMAHLVMTSRASVSIKHAMSHPLWTPLARLTFGAYLYHPIIMYSYYFSSTRPLDMTGTLIFQNWIFFTILSFLASFVSFLLIERPTENLEGILIDIMKEKAKMNRHQRQELHHSDLEAAEQKVSLLSEAEDKALDDGEHHL